MLSSSAQFLHEKDPPQLHGIEGMTSSMMVAVVAVPYTIFITIRRIYLLFVAHKFHENC